MRGLSNLHLPARRSADGTSVPAHATTFLTVLAVVGSHGLTDN
jgi:hypothetical protein